MNLALKVSAKSIATFFLKIISGLLLANLLSIYLRYVLGYESAMGFIPMFDFDRELNIPAVYSALAILFAAGVLWFIAKDQEKKAERAQSIYWKMLAIIFVFLSIDELISVHEHFSRINGVFSDELNRYAQAVSNKIWFIPYGICFIAIGAFFIRFFLKLPYPTKKAMLLAGIVFVSGAVGMELLGGITASDSGGPTVLYALTYTAEELLEMLGIVLLIHALIQHIAMYCSQDSLQIHAQVIAPQRSNSSASAISSAQTSSVIPAISENQIDSNFSHSLFSLNKL